MAHSTPVGGGGGRGAAGPRPWAGYAWALALVAVATAAALAIDAVLALPDVALLYLAAIMLSAAWHGRGPSTFAAAVSVAAFNYFLVEPRFTFEVAEPRYVLTFTMMFGIGLVISGLTSRLRTQQREAEAREAKTHALYALGRALAAASGPEEILRVVVEQARRAFATEVELVEVEHDAWTGAASLPSSAAIATAIERRRVVPSGGALVVPLVAGDAVHGVLVFADPEPARRPIDPDFLESFVRQGAIAIAQGRAAAVAAQAEGRARAEEVRSTLLAAVSHDLRTPLAVITGAATTLQGERLGREQRDELLATVADEAERLEQMIGNLLDMTRLQAGGVVLRAQWLPLEEVVGSALLRLERRIGDRPVEVEIAADLPLLWVDPVLLEQALVNLADNALKYSPEPSAIEVRSFVRGGVIAIEVLDRGPGLPVGLGPRVFEKFVRGDARDRDGFGLGLAICRAIVELHGGAIAARPREGGGACIEITLPLRVDQPAAAIDAPAVRESA